MAFIDDFNKLVVTKGQQQKVTNKDKAIIDLANEVANGGGQTTNIVKCWSVYLDTITEIQKEVGEEKYKLEMNASGTEYYFTTNNQQPDTESGSNIAFNVVVDSSTQIEFNIAKPIKIAQLLESHKDKNNDLTPPTGSLVLFEGQHQILTIDLIYTHFE